MKNYTIIKRKNGIAYIQRTGIETGSESPLTLQEEIIIELNERVKLLEQFMRNGYEYGYIHFDPINKHDSAYDTFLSIFGEERVEEIKKDYSEM